MPSKLSNAVASASDSAAPPRVAYIMSRFPKITETFVLYEMVAVEREGVEIEIYPLWRERTSVVHAEAEAYVRRACFQSSVSWPVMAANFAWLAERPLVYLRTLLLALSATWGSPRFFFGILAIYAKAAFFARTMRGQGVTHVHAHFAHHPAAAAFIIHRLAKIPYSFTAHGSDLHRERRMLCEKTAEAAFVVAISRYNRDLILRECPRCSRDKIRVIHCGVDVEKFVPADEGERRTAPGRVPTIVCIGTMHEVKGQKHLIDACQLLKQRGIKFSLHFVGDGPDFEARRRQAARAGLADDATFHGRQNRDQVRRLLQEADMLAAPSVLASDGRREGIPVVIMEAMASAVAVVASRLSGIPELVVDGQSGLLAPPGDAESLARALERLIRDPHLRRQLAVQGREKVVREFNQQRAAQLLVEQIRKSTGCSPAAHDGETAIPPSVEELVQ